MVGRAMAAAAAFYLALSATLASPASADSPSCPVVVAHRAGGTYAPENTLPGITAAAAAGATWTEADVRLSKSEFPVLMHDTTVDRTTDGTGAVADLWLSDLTSLWAADFSPWRTDPRYTGVKVPYAWDFFNAAKQANTSLLLDQKAISDYGLDRLRHYADVHGWREHTLVMLPPAQIAQARGWEPTLRFAAIEYNPRMGTVTQQIRTGEALQALGVSTYVVPARDISPAAVDYWHSYGVQVWTWTTDNGWPDTAAEWTRVRTAGVDGIITNNPAGLVATQAGGC